MIITGVKIENFLSIRRMDLYLPERGVLFLVGPNGAGKSAVLHAIAWAVFGEILRPLPVQGVRTEQAGAGAIVRVRVFFGEGYVERALNRSSTVLEWSLPTGGTSGETPTERQAALLNQLGWTFDSWRVGVHFASGFRFLGLGNADRVRLLDQLTGATRLAAARDRAAARASGLAYEGSAYERTVEQLIGRAAEARGVVVGTASGYWAACATANADREALQAEHGALLEQVVQAQHQVQQQTHQLAVLEGQRAELERRIHVVEERAFTDPRAQHQAAQAMLRVLLGRLQNTQADLAVAQSGVCPLCTQPVSARPDVLSFLQQQADSQATEVQSLTATARAHELAFAEYDQTVADLRKLRDLALNATQAHYALSTGCNAAQQALQNLSARVAILESRLAARRTVVPGAVSEGLTEINQHLGGAMESWAAARATERAAKIVGFWVDGFSRTGIRNFLLERLFPRLNSALTHHMEVLSDGLMSLGLGATVLRGGTVKDEIAVSLINRNGSSVLGANSSGEQALYDLAVIAAFSSLLNARETIGWLFLDEVFAHLHEGVLPRVAAWLRELGATRQIVAVAHQPGLAEQFPRVCLENVPGHGTTITEAF